MFVENLFPDHSKDGLPLCLFSIDKFKVIETKVRLEDIEGGRKLNGQLPEIATDLSFKLELLYVTDKMVEPYKARCGSFQQVGFSDQEALAVLKTLQTIHRPRSFITIIPLWNENYIELIGHYPTRVGLPGQRKIYKEWQRCQVAARKF